MELLNTLDTNKFFSGVNRLNPNDCARMRPIKLLILCLCCLFSIGCIAADSNVTSTLKRYEGHWDTSIKWGNSETPEPIKWEGTTSTKLLGNNWLSSQHLGDYLGVSFDARESLGFDERENAWTSIWVDRNQDSVQIMSGQLDQAGGLQLSGQTLDQESGQWFAIKRNDQWTEDDVYVTTFIKQDEKGEMIEELTVTHTRITTNSEKNTQF